MCQKSKKCLSSVLEKAKELWSVKKCHRLDLDEIVVNEHLLAGLILNRELPSASADMDVVEVCHNIFIECKC